MLKRVKSKGVVLDENIHRIVIETSLGGDEVLKDVQEASSLVEFSKEFYVEKVEDGKVTIRMQESGRCEIL